LAAEGVWSAPVYTYEEVAEDLHIKSGGMVITQRHAEIGEYRLIGNPIRMSATPPTYRTPPPPLGADTEDVLVGLGLGAKEVAELRAQGVI
jgi:crotonobetainyl-CoA:carnitine CoA-transferase CaiB-like acyl-CoA transferase